MSPSNGEHRAFSLPLVELDTLDVDPLLLALLQCAAYLDLSEDDAVDPTGAVNALEHMSHYVRELDEDRLVELQDQLDTIAEYAEGQGWEPDSVEFVRDFLINCGALEEEDEPELDAPD